MKCYNMIIYTASDQSYADSVVNHIDPMKTYFKFRLYRHNCVQIDSDKGKLYIKDLRIIRNIPIENMVIIDNSVLSFAFHLDNGIPILPFYSNKEDIELVFLKNYLVKLAKYDNIPKQNGPTFNLTGTMEDAVKGILDDTEPETNKSLKSLTSNNSSISPVKKEGKTMSRTNKLENLELQNDEKLLKNPIKKKSKIQNQIYVTLNNIKKGYK